MEKLKSRKLWITLAAIVLQLVGPSFGVPQQAIESALKVIGFYLGSQGLVDAVTALKNQV